MPNDPKAAEHRRRAADLRRLATHLDATPLPEMIRMAGPDTWVSPRAAELRDQLGLDRARLQSSVDELRRQAHWLDQQADALDAAALARIAAGLVV